MSYLVSTLSISTDESPPLTPPRAASLIALNFLMALAVSELSIMSSGGLGLEEQNHKIVGLGGYSIIETGKMHGKGQVIAVKHNRLFAQGLPRNVEKEFDRHFLQLVLELRILSHKCLALNPHIINVLGLLVAEGPERPLLSLILEYSPHGDLRNFLMNLKFSVTVLERVRLARQVARGLEALHKLQICHGDVKPQNVLFSSDKDQWSVKLSDFGLSVIACQQDPSGRLGFPSGTSLYNAPEIRKGIESDDENFTIGDAMLTDIFSFGLLFWEVLRHGHSYTQDIRIDHHTSCTRECQIILDHLNEQAPDSLLEFALASVNSMALDLIVGKRAEAAIRGSLRDLPKQRTSMALVSKILDVDEPFTNSQAIPRVENGEGEFSFDDAVEWTGSKSLYDLLSVRSENSVLIPLLPAVIREQAMSELEALYNTENISIGIRAQAAMTLSECYTIGFGGCRDQDNIVQWLGKAASLQDCKARKWYFRVCDAFSIPFEDRSLHFSKSFEKDLSGLPTEQYLISRIRSLNVDHLKDAEQTYKLFAQAPKRSSTSCCFRVAIFNQEIVDDLSELHVASWLGDESQVRFLLQSMPVDLKSSQGLTPLHYACFGGKLSTVRLLLSRNASARINALFGLSPLHLCMHFSEADLCGAVSELLNHGASPSPAFQPQIIDTQYSCFVKHLFVNNSVDENTMMLLRTMHQRRRF